MVKLRHDHHEKNLIKKAQKPCSPLEKAWKILLFFSLRVQHVIKELCPQLGAKQMKRLGKRYQTRTLTCHQRLKLSFTTHLFFTVLTLFSNVGRIVTELSKCRESNSPQYICRKEDNKQNPQCQNNRGGTFPVKLRVMYAYLTLNPPIEIDIIRCLLKAPGVPPEIGIGLLDFPTQGQLLCQSQSAASSALV